MTPARLLKPALLSYSGKITDPKRWDMFQPRVGDVVLTTPAKSGTTWTQTIIAMLLNNGPELPGLLGHLSPWVDANFFPEDDVFGELEAQTGRRVIKTHTPGDGVPVWEGVKYVSVFRHPMEAMLSLRKHVQNTRGERRHAMLKPLGEALTTFLDREVDVDSVDSDCLTGIVRHFEKSVLSGHLPDPLVMNYAAMKRDRAGAVARLDEFLGTGCDADTLSAITEATGFGAMKANALQFAPEAGRGFWKEDKGFFAGGKSGAWQSNFEESQIAQYEDRFRQVLPNAAHRHWIETGEGEISG